MFLSVLSIKLLHVDTTNTHSYNSTEPVLKKLMLTWLVAQYIHGGHKLFASLFILALLIKQTPEIHIVVWIILRQQLNQSLEKQNQIFQQNKLPFMWSDGDSFSTCGIPQSSYLIFHVYCAHKNIWTLKGIVYSKNFFFLQKLHLET